MGLGGCFSSFSRMQALVVSLLSLSTDFIYFLAGFQFQFLSLDPVPFYALIFLRPAFPHYVFYVQFPLCFLVRMVVSQFLSPGSFQLTGDTLLYSTPIWHLQETTCISIAPVFWYKEMDKWYPSLAEFLFQGSLKFSD